MKILFQFVRLSHFFKGAGTEKEHFARKLVGFSSDELYTVVADVKNYEEFVPFCRKSTILSSDTNQLKANLEIGFPPISEDYTSTVTLIQPSLVRAVCSEGRLFDYLETKWRFSPGLKSNPRSCIVDFYINFKFKSVFHSQVALFFFDNLVQQMESAFLDETARRYGKPSIPMLALKPVKSDIKS